jgi:hypothetical protein
MIRMSVRRSRTRWALPAVWGTAIALFAPAPSCAATIVSVDATTPHLGSCFPFGEGIVWTPYMGFVYENIPPFELKTGDTVAFDLGVPNDVNIGMNIDMAPTLTNGGDTPGALFTNIIGNTQTPTNPHGNAVVGDYELGFKAQAPFSFAGGGLIIRFSNPSPAYALDATCTGQAVGAAGGTDGSGRFVERFSGDADGAYPWSNVTQAAGNWIAQFRITRPDPATPGPTGQRAAALKKCKKKHSHKAKKKCKKKARRLPV